MNTFSTLNLGNFPATTSAITIPGMTFPTSGNYTVEALINGQFYLATIASTAGNPVTISNAYQNDATVMARIKLPSADRTNVNNYLNDSAGHIWFQWSNVPA